LEKTLESGTKAEVLWNEYQKDPQKNKKLQREISEDFQKYADAYTPEMQTTLLLPAGVTSLAAIEFRHEAEKIAKWTEQGLSVDEAYIQHILPEKMQYNIDYLNECSLKKDIAIMVKTVIAVLK